MGKERPPDLTGTSGSGRRMQRPQVHARAEQIQTVFQTCAPGPEIIGGGAPGNPTTTQRSGRGWERTSKGAQRGMPTPGRPERSGLCEDDDPGIFGYFPSMESTSPGGEISPIRGPVRAPAPTEGIIRWRHHRRGGCPQPPGVLSSAPSSVSSSQAAYPSPRHKCHGSLIPLLVLSPM